MKSVSPQGGGSADRGDSQSASRSEEAESSASLQRQLSELTEALNLAALESEALRRMLAFILRRRE